MLIAGKFIIHSTYDRRKKFLFNLEKVKQRIKDACDKSGRDMDGVTLLPVTKNWPVDAVRYCKNSKINWSAKTGCRRQL